MSNTTDIIQKVKEELNIGEEISDVNLLEKFKLYIAQNHPDKYTDDELKKEAEEKCKNLNVMYDGLKKHIEQKRLRDKALVGYNPEDIVKFDYINAADAKDKEIVQLKNKNSLLEGLNLPSVFISWLLIGISSLWILSWLRSLVVEKIVDKEIFNNVRYK